MGWSIGYDDRWQRDIGYGVPAYCDHPECLERIDRGLDYVCGGEPYGGESGCGLYFCSRHVGAADSLCDRCVAGDPPFEPSPDHPKWVRHKLGNESWAGWRAENADEAARLLQSLAPTPEDE